MMRKLGASLVRPLVSQPAFGYHEGVMTPRTMFDKIWDSHVVREEPGKPALLYVDLHLVHEVTSAQAFEGLRLAGRTVRRPDLTVATVDHNVPTIDRLNIKDEISRKQLEALKQKRGRVRHPLLRNRV